MAQWELMALDTVNTDSNGKYRLISPGAGDSYIAPRVVHFGEMFTVETSDLVASLNASFLNGKASTDFVESAHVTDPDTHTNLIVDGQYF